MTLRIRKIDAIIVAGLCVTSALFLWKSGYVTPFTPPTPPPSEPDTVIPSVILPTPPTSFVPAIRRDVTPEDEGVHFDELRVSREWWYFSAIFTDKNSALRNWSVAVSFNHMARSDLLGSLKPDLLVVSLFGANGETYGGMINKQRYLGILNQGTLIASSPGVNVQFEDSWVEGQYPTWHVHAVDNDIDTTHEIILDLDYTASSSPLWTMGAQAFNKTESELNSYVFAGCTVTGNVSIDGKKYFVSGTGHHEHVWTPHIITRATINGWDWFYVTCDNGYELYVTNFLPFPQSLSGKLSSLDSFGTFLLTADHGKTFTELKNVHFKTTKTDQRIFPFVKMPAAYSTDASPSFNSQYFVSQSMLYGSNLQVSADVAVPHAINKVWKFPSYVGMKIGSCTLDGTLSWSDAEGDHEIPMHGVGVSWSMRALL